MAWARIQTDTRSREHSIQTGVRQKQERKTIPKVQTRGATIVMSKKNIIRLVYH